MWLRSIVLVQAFLFVSSAPVSADILVSQKDQRFAPGKVQIKAGESIRVANDDIVIHHAYVETPQFEYDSGEQPPGRNLTIRFPEPGDYEVLCAIHPKMTLTVKVTK